MPLLLLSLTFLWLLVYLLARWLDRRRGSQWRLDVASAGVLALACLGFTWRLWFDGAFMPADGGDLVSFLLPTYRFAAESLRAGQFPLWNPHLYSGAPHVADSQAGFLYPPNLALFLLRPDFGVKALEALSTLHLWWAGLGMYVFVRILRWGEDGAEQAGRLAALGAGIAFAFSDSLWIHFGNLNYIAVASWLPWVMTCFVQALDRGRGEGQRSEISDQTAVGNNAQDLSSIVHRSSRSNLGWAALGGLLLGVGTLAGHVQASLFIGMTIVLYGLFWLAAEWRVSSPRAAMLRLVTNILVLAGVAILVAAPVLLPSLQLAPYLDRAAWRYQETVGYSFSPAQWIGLVIPGFFGRGPQLHWGLWPRVEMGYIGILPLALAALAILARRDRTTWTLLGVSGVAFVLSLGIYSVPHGWLTLLPGFDLLRAPARLTLVMDFGLAALAGIGLQVLISHRRVRGDGATWMVNHDKALTRLSDGLGWGSKAMLLVAVPLTFAALLLTQNQDPTLYLRVSVAAIAIFMFVALLLASWALVAARRAGWARPVTIGVLAVLLIYLDLASTGAYNDLSYDNPAQGYEHPEIIGFLAQQEQPVRIDARTGIDALWQPDTRAASRAGRRLGRGQSLAVGSLSALLGGDGQPLDAALRLPQRRVPDWQEGCRAGLEQVRTGLRRRPGIEYLPQHRTRCRVRRSSTMHSLSGETPRRRPGQPYKALGFDPAQQVVIEAGDAGLPAVSPTCNRSMETVRWLERSRQRSWRWR